MQWFSEIASDRISLRAFHPSDLTRAVLLLASLRDDADGDSVAAVVRALLECCEFAAIETAEGWMAVNRPKA